MDAAEVIESLGLVPHPEGGWYRETWRDLRLDEAGRSRGTAIYFLLVAEQRSHWHRVDAAEMWHHYAGDPLELWMAADDHTDPELHVVGPDLLAGQRPQAMVPAGVWQAAMSCGAWTLVGCTVTPGFEFEGWELAPEGFRPGTDAE
jgi:predicted cupin superfamily sugar epimerase